MMKQYFLAIGLSLFLIRPSAAAEFPQFDARAYCQGEAQKRADPTRNRPFEVEFQRCFAAERKGYDESLRRWPTVSALVADTCLRQQIGSYEMFASCLMVQDVPQVPR